MSRSRRLQAFLAALCLSVVAVDSASAQAGADAAPAPQTETVVAPEAKDGWLTQGRGKPRGIGQPAIANPFRSTQAPGAGALQDTIQPLPQAPANAAASAPAQAPGCPIGFRRRAGACVAIDIPENGTIDLTGRGWMCNRGFRRQDQGCVAVEMPENASLDATGHRWTCNYGFRRQAQTCVAVEVPQNASLDKAGHVWACNEGFERLENTCVDAATARLQKQADKAVNSVASGKVAPKKSITVNSGESRNGRTSKAKVVIGRF